MHSCKSGWLTCGLHSIDIRDVVVTLCNIVDEGKHPMLSMQQAFWCDSAISTLVDCTAGVAARMSADCMLTHMCTRYVRSVLQEATARANPPEHCLVEETNIHSVGSPARPESGLGNIRPVLHTCTDSTSPANQPQAMLARKMLERGVHERVSCPLARDKYWCMVSVACTA